MKHRRPQSMISSIVLIAAMLISSFAALRPNGRVLANTPNPTSVTIAGSLQSELGCSGDWQADCATTHLAYDAGDDVWQGVFSVPAGNWEYKATINDGWTENYGLNAKQDGANIPLNLAAPASVKFYYDHKSHWITDNQSSVIATVPGSFQSKLGCGGDWDAGCLRSWLQDPDGDGTYSFKTTAIPTGNYEAKVAINEDWGENYGQGGTPNGANIAFNVPSDNLETTFTYNSTTHILDIQVAAPPPPQATVTLVGDLQNELGCAGDWDPACAATHLTFDKNDDVYQNTWTLPVGDYQYKAAINDSWNENYGAGAVRDGANIGLSLKDQTSVKFYYDHKSHWITDNRNSVIATVPGSFQSELGCSGDWDAGCLRSWLQDPDGDGIYTFETNALKAGSYEGKVAINEGWDENYGQGGVPGGPNIGFTVPYDNAKLTFSYNAKTHVLRILYFTPDNNVAWDGLKHDSRDTLYRTPGGAVPSGSTVLVRFRTFYNDVTGVSLRVYDLNASAQSVTPMTRVASDMPCYQAGLEKFTCDYWQATIRKDTPNNLWYRFLVTDGSKTVYYADNTSALDGGLGAPSDNVVDNSYALMFYDPNFEAPAWAKGASIYQIFPDRFRDGRTDNNPKTGDVRYDDPVLKLNWGTLPEGYCRNYADASKTTCPWRFDDTPPSWSPDKEGPRGRDYFGGDLKGVDQYLDYLKALGVNTLYFNPIFDAGSNHSYDTQNYYQVDPYFGTQKDFDNLVKHTNQLGMRIVLDGVFNHMSSDSPIFDRYGHYAEVGACESLTSKYRSWFTFRDVPAGTGTCVGSAGANSATYDGWFGFDSIPVINKTNLDVQAYFLTAKDSVAKHWLTLGAGGWRMDVMGDASFPDGYWETFRKEVKTTRSDALIISETWQKDSTLLRMLRGDRADSTMNYRLRDAVIGLLATQGFDSKGFADSGRIISPSEFAARMESIREDYPDAAYYSAMNLLDSHDTERLRWTLTPGEETTANKEGDAAKVAEGKLRQKLASVIQFTVPGAPTVFYGDEVGVTGDDDPDDRRTYPWTDLGGSPDQTMFNHYKALNTLRSSNSVLINGDFKILLADDSTNVVAYGRKINNQAAVIIINRGNVAQSGAIPVAGYLPNGITLKRAYAIGTGSANSVTVVNGKINGSLGALSAVIFISGSVDLQSPNVPANLKVTGEGNGFVELSWTGVPGAAGYNLYRSRLSGGGYEKVNGSSLTGTGYKDTDLTNATSYYYVVTSFDAAGNESKFSNEVVGLPHLIIGWANLQWPPAMTHTLSAVDRTDTAYGQVWIDGFTSNPGPTESLRAQLGFGPSNSDPNGNANWIWTDASFNVNVGSNDEFMASMLPEATGQFDYAFRYTTTNGRDWIYADLDGINNGYSPSQAGKLTVNASADTTLPAVPANLTVVSASPAGVALQWDAVQNDPTLYGYEVLRSDTAGGPYVMIGRVTSISYTDTSVSEGATYYYVVRSIDTSFNRSGNSNEVSAKAQLRIVNVVFNVTVPATTDATGLPVHIAGTMSRFIGGYPDWSPGEAKLTLTRVDATHWTISLTGYESTAIEYKYALGDWNYVEKDASCSEIGNRQLTLSYGANGTQTVNDTVVNWRNVAPCGN